jgi:CubicO group peptidase (beta-lactamase class C family)
MSSHTISQKAILYLETYIDVAIDPGPGAPDLPFALVHVVNAQNKVLFSYGNAPDKRPTSSSMVIVQSLTKIVGAMAYMQLVEKGLATLDDPATINNWLPELATKQVLTGYTIDSEIGKKVWQLEDRRGDITARMLMNHTYGGGHTYFNKLLLEYIQDLGEGVWETTNEASNPYGILLASPLLWQPGTHTNYGQGLDWIAVLIERITKQSLASYLQDNIFDPLGLKEIGFEPQYGGDVVSSPHNTGKFWPRKLRSGQGFVTIDSPEPETVRRRDAFPGKEGNHHVGCLGTGLVASVGDYTHLVTVLLPQNAGVDPVSGRRILSSESALEICRPQLPRALRNDSRCLLDSAAAPIIVPVDLTAPLLDPHGSFGLGCGVQGADRVLTNGQKGRSVGSVYWYGATNVEFWIDREKEIVVAVWGNYYPFCEKAWMDFVGGVEGLLYKGLERE